MFTLFEYRNGVEVPSVLPGAVPRACRRVEYVCRWRSQPGFRPRLFPEQLGHAKATFTQDVYSHVLSQRTPLPRKVEALRFWRRREP